MPDRPARSSRSPRSTSTWRRSARSARPRPFSRPAKICRPPQRDKTISYWSALIRGSATRNGHNPDIGEAFMNKEKEVKIGERVVHPKGSLLTSERAGSDRENQRQTAPRRRHRRFGRRPDAKGGTERQIVVTSIQADLSSSLFGSPRSRPCSFSCGILGAYLEFKIPGASLPGIHRRNLFRAFFPRPLSRRAGGLGSGRALRSRCLSLSSSRSCFSPTRRSSSASSASSSCSARSSGR